MGAMTYKVILGSFIRVDYLSYVTKNGIGGAILANNSTLRDLFGCWQGQNATFLESAKEHPFADFIGGKIVF